MICRLLLLMSSFVIVSTLFPNMLKKKNYNYDFEVFPVDRCPMNESDWQAAAARIGCDDSRGYHCVPDKFHETLIEFCYYKPRILVSKGNCLELAANGILNHAKCRNFTWGCPEKSYLSDRIYNYPTCLNIGIGCFTSDIACLRQKVQFEDKVKTTEHSVKEICKKYGYVTTKSSFPSVIIALAIVSAIVTPLLISCIFIFCKRYGLCDHLRNANHNDNQRKSDEQLSKFNPKSFETVNNGDEDDNRFDLKPLIDVETNKPNNLRIESLQNLHNIIAHSEDQEFRDLCKGFDKESFQQLNHKGFNSLHLSAKCGSLIKFKHLLNLNVEIESLTADGQNSLHIAAFFGSQLICRYILESHKDLFDITDRYNMNPAHWAAHAGQDSILKLFAQYGCNLSVTTRKYEENIVFFACIGESYEVCKFVSSNKDIAELLHATNSEGWNAIHYAAKNGNLEIFRYLCECGVNIRNESKQTGKTCLHTACEKSNIEICRYILKEQNDSTLITQLDKRKQHVGHYAAKSGNIEILELLIEKLRDTSACKPPFLENATTDNINILHIACRHAQVQMCVKIADTFPGLINKITEKGWNAALFVTEKAGAERERIEILKYLESRKLNVYQVTRSGKTILYNACANQSRQLVKYLLSRYPDLLNIKKSMDPKKASKPNEINDIFEQYFEGKRL